MLSTKAKELIELLGSDEQAISDVVDIIREAKETQTAAAKAGHSLKAAKPPVAGDPAAAAAAASGDPAIDDPEDLIDGGADEDQEDGEGDGMEATVAEMTPMELHEQLQTVIDATVQKALGPLMDLLKTATSATAATTKEVQDGFNARLDQVAKTMKEAEGKAEQRLAALEGTVKELAGETPRAFAGGYRASQDKGTVTQQAQETHKAQQPAQDPFAVTFFNELGMPLGGAPVPQS